MPTDEIFNSELALKGQIDSVQKHYDTVLKSFSSGKKLGLGADILNEAYMDTTSAAFIAAYLRKVQTDINRLKADFLAL